MFELAVTLCMCRSRKSDANWFGRHLCLLGMNWTHQTIGSHLITTFEHGKFDSWIVKRIHGEIRRGPREYWADTKRIFNFRRATTQHKMPVWCSVLSEIVPQNISASCLQNRSIWGYRKPFGTLESLHIADLRSQDLALLWHLQEA